MVALLLAHASAVSIQMRGRCSPFATNLRARRAHPHVARTSCLRLDDSGLPDSLPRIHSIQSPRAHWSHSSCGVPLCDSTHATASLHAPRSESLTASEFTDCPPLWRWQRESWLGRPLGLQRCRLWVLVSLGNQAKHPTVPAYVSQIQFSLCLPFLLCGSVPLPTGNPLVTAPSLRGL